MLPGRRGYRELNIGSVAAAQSVHLAADTNTECRPVEIWTEAAVMEGIYWRMVTESIYWGLVLEGRAS